MYICFDPESGMSGKGSTLTEAYKNFIEYGYDDTLAEDCVFFEGKEVKVTLEIKAVPVTTVKKSVTITKKGNN